MVRIAALLAAAALAEAANPTLSIVAFYPASQLPQGQLTVRGTLSALSANGTAPWQTGEPLTSVGTDQFVVTLPLSPSDFDVALQFKIVAGDGSWQAGVNEAMIINASEGASSYSHTVYPFFDSQQPGRYTYLRALYSPQLNNTRDLVVYLPPGYDENPYKQYYPDEVLIAHDGQNLFNASTATYGVAWEMQNTLDPMILNGQARPLIVVGVDNTDNRIYEYTYSNDPTAPQAGGGADLYLDFLEQTVLPTVQGAFRINGAARPGQATPQRWGMLGSSLGGLLSCYAGWTRPDVWGGFLGCMSSSFWWNNEDFNGTILERKPANGGVYPPAAAFYLDSGDAGPGNDDVNQTITIRDRLLGDFGFAYANDTWAPVPVPPAATPVVRQLGYYLDPGGEHSESYWGARFHVPVTFAFGRPLVLPAVPV